MSCKVVFMAYEQLKMSKKPFFVQNILSKRSLLANTFSNIIIEPTYSHQLDGVVVKDIVIGVVGLGLIPGPV